MTDAELVINKVIAEKLFGWSMYHYDKDIEENCYYSLLDDHANPVNQLGWMTQDWKTEDEAWRKDCPNFAGDLQAAWSALERLMALYREGNSSLGIWVLVYATRFLSFEYLVRLPAQGAALEIATIISRALEKFDQNPEC